MSEKPEHDRADTAKAMRLALLLLLSPLTIPIVYWVMPRVVSSVPPNQGAMILGGIFLLAWSVMTLCGVVLGIVLLAVAAAQRR